MRGIRLIAAIAVFGATAAPALAGDLEIVVEAIRNDAGKVLAALHAGAGAGTFPDAEGAVAAQWATAAPGDHRFVFTDLPAGEFAVAVFHDENDNGELDSNFLGIPTEGYGFSRNATGTFGPPGFSHAAVEVPTGDATARTAAKLIYQDD